jgi:cytochrome c peroxidase
MLTGGRAAPSLRYVDRTPRFHIGPDVGVSDESDSVIVPATSAVVATPHGGLFWDGRAGTLQNQAMGPLFNPAEMANATDDALAARLRQRYGAPFAALFGAETVAPADRFVAEVTFAIARYQLEDSSFHPYDSKYDAYLEGRATLTTSEARGLAVFDDSTKGNCAACHLDRPTADGRPPVLTDYEYEAVGVPRNPALAANRDAQHFDLGLCGPLRTDLASHEPYCGMFRTPSLRNVALRSSFFHNGAFRTLDEAVAFYVFRDTRPEQVYPRSASGAIAQFNDLPASDRRNVDVTTAPFGRKRGDEPPMTPREMQDVVAFLKTLTDGYRN